jgi:hypothetical protein
VTSRLSETVDVGGSEGVITVVITDEIECWGLLCCGFCTLLAPLLDPRSLMDVVDFCCSLPPAPVPFFVRDNIADCLPAERLLVLLLLVRSRKIKSSSTSPLRPPNSTFCNNRKFTKHVDIKQKIQQIYNFKNRKK